MIKKTLLAATFAALPFLANAQGYQVALQGAKQTGMAHIGVATKEDVTAIYFNPGALSLLEKNGVAVGASAIMVKNSFMETGTNRKYESNNPLGTPFYFYGAWGPKGEGLASRFKFGLGVYTPFGSSVTWGDSWPGRYTLNSIVLRAIFIQPTASFKITNNFGIGVGVSYAIGGVNLKRNVGFPSLAPDASAELDGSANGLGFSAGVYYQPIKQLSLGITYRSQVDMKIEEGTINISNIPAFLSNTSGTAFLLPSTSFKSALPLPGSVAFGATVYATDKLTLAGELTYTAWSAYDSLRFDYKDSKTTNPANQLTNTRSPRNYNDNLLFRVGASYKVTEAITARAGYAYGITPVPNGSMTPETPDADRSNYFLGLGYKMGALSFDAALQLVDVSKRTDTSKENGLSGTYKTNATVIAIGVGYEF